MQHTLTFFLTLLAVASAFGANPLGDAVALWNFDDFNDSNGENNRLDVVRDVPVGNDVENPTRLSSADWTDVYFVSVERER